MSSRNVETSRYKRGILAHFENNNDFKATYEFYLDLKSTLKSTLISEKQFCAHIQVNLDFKTTWFQDNLNHLLCLNSWVLKRVWIIFSWTILLSRNRDVYLLWGDFMRVALLSLIITPEFNKITWEIQSLCTCKHASWFHTTGSAEMLYLRKKKSWRALICSSVIRVSLKRKECDSLRLNLHENHLHLVLKNFPIHNYYN